MGLRSSGLPEILVIVSIASVLGPLRTIPFWKILSKAGIRVSLASSGWFQFSTWLQSGSLPLSIRQR
jgi:hypothetical protein